MHLDLSSTIQLLITQNSLYYMPHILCYSALIPSARVYVKRMQFNLYQFVLSFSAFSPFGASPVGLLDLDANVSKI